MNEETELELRQQIGELRMLVEALMTGGEMLHEPSTGGYTMPEGGGADPQPFEVRWGASENSGSGAWIIYLKTGFVQVCENDIDVTTAMTAASENDWYIVSGLSEGGGTVWLSIKLEGTNGAEAKIGTSADTSGGWFNVKVATVARSGEPVVETKSQYLTTAYVHAPIPVKGNTENAETQYVTSIHLKSADDSAVEATVTKNATTGVGEVKLGVYYK